MPLNGSDVASKPPGTTAVANTTIESAPYNSVIDDIYQILNTPRSVAKGSTGATNAKDARANLSAIGYYGAGAPLPSSDEGPIWHADYASIMTWDGTGYASVNIGESRMFAANSVPTGFLEENGAAISRSTYAALFRKIGTTWGSGDGSTTFNLPDSRGEFLRGFDNGRGVDSGRTFASSQSSQNLSHNHGVTDPTHTHSLQNPSNTSNKFHYAGNTPGSFGDQIGLGGQGGVAYGNPVEAASTGISIQNSGGSEARPRNVTRLICIKF